MKLINTPIKDLYIIEPKVFGDDRGFFYESYSQVKFKEFGINIEFRQDNHAKSMKGVLRGLHWQNPPTAQTKLVRVIRGSVYDVAVDLRKGSGTYGKWYGLELSEKNRKMFLVPQGFAHGYCTLEDDTEFLYKVDNFYAPDLEDGIIWNDPELNIPWPVKEPLLSEKDRELKIFKEIESAF